MGREWTLVAILGMLNLGCASDGAAASAPPASGNRRTPTSLSDVRGVSYIRLNNPKGGKHTTFAPEAYEPAAVGRMMTVLHDNGFNCVRVFLSVAHCRPGSMFPMKTDREPSKKYLDNVADFLRQARAADVRVVLTIEEFQPLTARYAGIAGTQPSKLVYTNRMLLDADYIRARQAFLTDLVGEIRARGGELLPTVLAWEVGCESCFGVGDYPFNQAEGLFVAPNGKQYDLAKDKVALADDAAVFWTDAMVDGVKRADPDARVLVSIFTHAAVRRAGPTDFSHQPAAWLERIPFRPLALAASKADIISVHFYPADEREFQAELKSIEFDAFRAAALRRGKTLMCTEFGAFKKPHAQAEPAAAWLVRLRQMILDQGFAGCVLWQYDTHEQPELWNAMENDGGILRALSKAHR